MMILTGARNESTIFVLEDGSEIAVTIIEPEQGKTEVLVTTEGDVSVVHNKSPTVCVL